MKLVLDLGNTFQKLAVFSVDDMVYNDSPKQIDTKLFETIFARYAISSCLLSSVIHHQKEIETYLHSKCKLVAFNHTTPIPIKNRYQTLQTLGKDRLASAVAAQNLYPFHDVLVVDAGTCLKFDFVNAQAEYMGGAISPGLRMRFSALHTFTDKLPLIELIRFETLIGKNTEESLLSGVINGTIAEIDGIIDRYRANYPQIKVVLSGGDAEYLVNKLKNKIFAVSNIVLTGLKIILDYNDNP
ncbi:MAG: type III pantothenate kinase [Bacteroidota bacterium]